MNRNYYERLTMPFQVCIVKSNKSISLIIRTVQHQITLPCSDIHTLFDVYIQFTCVLLSIDTNFFFIHICYSNDTLRRRTWHVLNQILSYQLLHLIQTKQYDMNYIFLLCFVIYWRVLLADDRFIKCTHAMEKRIKLARANLMLPKMDEAVSINLHLL